MIDTAHHLEPIPRGAGNARLKRLRRLVRQSKVRSDERAFVVDGPTLVVEALASPCPVEGIYLGAVHGLELLTSALDEAGMALGSTPVHTVDDETLTSILDPTNPRPVAAVVESPSFALTDIRTDLPLLVAVELRDPGNLGTIIRTAEAAGFGGVVIAGTSVDHLNPKVVRSSAGSLFRLPIVVYGDGGEAVDAIRSSRRPVLAAVVAPSAPAYDRVDLTSAAIMVGNEPRGLDGVMVAAADGVVTIPMADGVESLNVGAAAAVLAFEVARQRRNRR